MPLDVQSCGGDKPTCQSEEAWVATVYQDYLTRTRLTLRQGRLPGRLRFKLKDRDSESELLRGLEVLHTPDGMVGPV